MSWGDPHSREVRAVLRRHDKGIDTPAKRRVLRRSVVPRTRARRRAEERHSDVWQEQTSLQL